MNEKAQELVLINDQEAITVPIDAVAVRTERQCQSRPFFSFTAVSTILRRSA